MTQDIVIRSWIARILLSIALILTLKVIRTDMKNKAKATENNTLVLPKYLNLFSISTYCSSCIGILIYLSNRVPYLCLFTSYLVPLALTTPKVCLGMFQIARLKLCFSEHKIHSSFGYSRWTFTALYCVGFLQLFTQLIHPWFSIAVEMNAFKDGCSIRPRTDHGFNLYAICTLSGLLVLIMWDLTILLMYVLKIYQFKHRKSSQGKLEQNVFERVREIMRKIVVLTIVGELVAICSVSVALFIIQLWHHSIFATFIIYVAFSIDFVMVSCVLYLMLEHNNKHYEALLETVSRLTVCHREKVQLPSIDTELKQSQSIVMITAVGQSNHKDTGNKKLVRKMSTMLTSMDHPVLEIHEMAANLSEETETDQDID